MINETEKEKHFDIISNFKDKNEKLAWIRKRKKIEALVDKLEPIEMTMLKYVNQKNAIMDEINSIRKEMVKDCIHPHDNLIHYENFILCKFCNSKLSIPKTPS